MRVSTSISISISGSVELDPQSDNSCIRSMMLRRRERVKAVKAVLNNYLWHLKQEDGEMHFL